MGQVGATIFPPTQVVPNVGSAESCVQNWWRQPFFKSTATQKQYTIRQSVNCKSDWVIYLGTCLKCKGQYVGKSKTVMKVRHSNHKQEIKKQLGGLGHHYGGPVGCGYENLTLTIIEQIEEKTLENLADRELYWQHQLRVYIENGYRNHCRKKEM